MADANTIVWEPLSDADKTWLVEHGESWFGPIASRRATSLGLRVNAPRDWPEMRRLEASLERCLTTLDDFIGKRDRELSRRIGRLQRIVRHWPRRSPFREEVARLRFDFECRRGGLVGDLYTRIGEAERVVSKQRWEAVRLKCLAYLRGG